MGGSGLLLGLLVPCLASPSDSAAWNSNQLAKFNSQFNSMRATARHDGQRTAGQRGHRGHNSVEALLHSFSHGGKVPSSHAQQTNEKSIGRQSVDNDAIKSILSGGFGHKKQHASSGGSAKCPPGRMAQIANSFVKQGTDRLTAQFKATLFIQKHGCGQQQHNNVRIVKHMTAGSASAAEQKSFNTHSFNSEAHMCPNKRIAKVETAFRQQGDDPLTAHFRAADWVDKHGCYGSLPGSNSVHTGSKAAPRLTCTVESLTKYFISTGLDRMTAHFKASLLRQKGKGCNLLVKTAPPTPAPPTPAPCNIAQIKYWLVKKGIGAERAMYIAKGGVDAAIAASGGGNRAYFCGVIPTPSPTQFPTPIPTNATLYQELLQARAAEKAALQQKAAAEARKAAVQNQAPPAPSAAPVSLTKTVLTGVLSMLVMGYVITGCNYAADKMGGAPQAVEMSNEPVADMSRKSGGYQQQEDTWQKSSSSYQVADEELQSSRYQSSYSNEYNPDYSGGLSDDDVCPDVI